MRNNELIQGLIVTKTLLPVAEGNFGKHEKQ